jgi:hypothetical protein
MRFHAKNVAVGEACDEYFEVSFDCEPPGVDDFDPSVYDSPYLVVQRQFEDDDGGVCCGSLSLRPHALHSKLPEQTTTTSK